MVKIPNMKTIMKENSKYKYYFSCNVSYFPILYSETY